MCYYVCISGNPVMYLRSVTEAGSESFYIPPELQLCTDIMERFRGLNVQYSSTQLFIIKATLLTKYHILKSSA